MTQLRLFFAFFFLSAFVHAALVSWVMSTPNRHYFSVNEKRFAVTVKEASTKRSTARPELKQQHENLSHQIEEMKEDKSTLEQSSVAYDSNSKKMADIEIHAPLPVYPRLSRLRGEEGSVVLSVKISYRGIPVSVKVIQSSGFYLLDQAAINGLKEWRFEYVADRDDVFLETQKTIGFKLQ